MPLASESRVGVAGSSSKDMRSEDASFASVVTVAYSEGLDELIVCWPCSGLTLRGGAACARVWHKGGAMTVAMLWHICFCQLIENLLEVKFVVGRSGPIDVRHRVVLYDAALSPRKRSVAAEASEGTKGGERPVWSTLWFRKERRHATSQFTCLRLVCVSVASCGADVCLEEGGLGGMVWRRKASANEYTQDRTALVIPKSIKRMYAIRSRVPTHQSFFLALSDSGNTIGQQQCPHSWKSWWSSDAWTKFAAFLQLIFCIGTTSQYRENCGIGVSDVFLIGARGFGQKKKWQPPCGLRGVQTEHPTRHVFPACSIERLRILLLLAQREAPLVFNFQKGCVCIKHASNFDQK